MAEFKFLPPDSQTPVDSVGYRDWFYRIGQAVADLARRVGILEEKIIVFPASWVPLALGTEPLTFVSDGAGQPIFVPYGP